MLLPRRYWQDLSDEELVAARDEYRKKANGDQHLLKTADDIDDDLQRRATYRERTT